MPHGINTSCLQVTTCIGFFQAYYWEGGGGGGGGGAPSELPIPPAGSDILVEVWLLQKRWIGETGNHGGHRNVPSRPFSFGIRRKSKINMCTGHG